MIECRRRDGHHGLLAATGVVVGDEADGGELGPQLLQDLPRRGGHVGAVQRADQAHRLRQRGRRPVDVVPAPACAVQNAFEASRSVRVVARAPPDPGAALLFGVPRGERDAEGRRVGDPITRYARRLGRGFTLECGDHQRIPQSLDDGAGVADLAGEAQHGGARRVRERPDRVGARGHHGKGGSQREGLGHRVPARPPAIAQRLEDRMRRRLGEVELTHHVGEPQLPVAGAGERLDHVEHPRRRRRRRSANFLDSFRRGFLQ